MADERELRIAVAMNGGVSLAVWIGGVACELDALRRAAGTWDEVLKAAHRNVRIDVLAGTSVGGINAVFLALAQAYQDVNLAGLRQMWLDLADLDGPLMRSPSDKNRTSVLDGQYFYDQLREAVGSLVEGKVPTDRAVDLLITATALHGVPDDVLDDFGDVFDNNRYQTSFRFRRVPDLDWDDFGAVGNVDGARLLDQLATASRSTASFPVAFAPWFCDLDKLFKGDREPMRVELDQSRFLVDGGVLNNLPVDRCIESIFEQPADGLVDRVLLAVIPLHQRVEPDDDVRRRPDNEIPVPSPASVGVSSGVSIPRNETDAVALRRVTDRNEATAARRAARSTLLAQGLDDIHNAADFAFPSYQAYMAQLALDTNLGACRDQLNASGQMKLMPTAAALDEAVARATPQLGYLGWPWVPPAFPADRHWWGATASRRCGAMVLGLANGALGAGGDPVALATVKRDTHRAIAKASLVNPMWPRRWFGERVALGLIGGSQLQAAVDDAAAKWPTNGEDDRVKLQEAFHTLGELVTNVAELWAACSNPATPMPRALADLAAVPGDRVDRGRQLLAELEIVQYAFSGAGEPSEQSVRLGIASPNRAAPLDPLGRTDPSKKLSGEVLGHFGAFAKRSWRANDWLWGRLDAATMLGYLLNPEASAATADAIARCQREIVDEEAFYVCDAVVRDKASGAMCREGRKLFKAEKIPTLQQWEQRFPPADQREGPALAAFAEEFLALTGADLAASFLEKLTIGDETIAGESRSSLVVRVSTKAAATGTGVLSQAGLPAPVKRVVQTVLGPVRGVATVSYRYSRQARSFWSALLIGLGTAVAAALAVGDLLGVYSVGVLSPVLWTLVIAGALGGVLRAPFTSVVLIVLVGAVGLLNALGRQKYRWVHDHFSSWLTSPWFAIPVIAVGLSLVATRALAWLDDKVGKG